MICPNCNQQPITFISFVSKFNATKTKCQHCQANLKGNKLLHYVFYSGLVFGFLLGFSIAMLEDIYKWGLSNSLIIFILTLAIVGTPIEIIAWKYGSYDFNNNAEDKEPQANNASAS